MQNVVLLEKERRRRAENSRELAAGLASLAREVAKLAEVPVATKEQLKDQLSIIERSNDLMRTFIPFIPNSEEQARFSAHREHIQNLVELAGRRIAEL